MIQNFHNKYLKRNNNKKTTNTSYVVGQESQFTLTVSSSESKLDVFRELAVPGLSG